MALLNCSTTIEAEQTIAEIQRLLSNHGVTAMMTEYDGRNVSAVSFRMNIAGKPIAFKMPCNWRAVRKVFNDQGITRVKHKVRNLDNQAIRTAWRVIQSLIVAQHALGEVNMATIPQIFLPY